MSEHTHISRTWRHILALLLALAILPCSVLAETAGDKNQPAGITIYSPYAPQNYAQPERFPVDENLYFDDDPEITARYGFSYPWLTNLELARIKALQAAMKEGTAEDYSGPSVLNLPSVNSNDVAVYSLNPEDFAGERFFVFLPDSYAMDDDQLMSLLAAFEELGIDFDPESLNKRNCCRHCNILETRDLLDEEQTRMDKIVAQVRSGELKSISTDVNMLSVEKITERGWGFDHKRFLFYPYRSMTDDELTFFALEAETVWKMSPEDMRADGLNTLSKIIRIPEISKVTGSALTELDLSHNDLYFTDSAKLIRYDNECLLKHSMTSDSVSDIPSFLYMYHLQTPGSAPELGCIELFYPYYVGFSDQDYPTVTSDEQIRAAQQWAQDNLLLPKEDLPDNWFIRTTHTDPGGNSLIQLVLETPDWEINLWMYPNSMKISECRIYSLKWYLPGQKWHWA